MIAHLERLHPDVLSLRSHGFLLGSDLEHLSRVLEVGAPEATIFYGGRILEALSGAAVEAVGGEAKPNPFANLEFLREATLLRRDPAYWAHGLRRLGNEVRHLNRPIAGGEAELAALLVERWLEWFFVTFEAGPRLRSLAADPGLDDLVLFEGKDAALPGLLVAIDRPGGEEALAARDFTEPEVAALRAAPTAACVLAERWIERKRLAAAARLIEAIAPLLQGELRLLQLSALLAGRAGDFERTIALLRPKVADGLQDEETLGILAGGYKRRWDAKGQRADLEESHRLYRRGYRNTKEASYYLGINLAATALFLGEAEAAREQALKVAATIEAQAAAVAKIGRDLLKNSYWHAATAAEARLIAGDPEAARQSYAAAFVDFAEEAGSFGTTIKQARAIIAARGLTAQPFEDLFRDVGHPPPATDQP